MCDRECSVQLQLVTLYNVGERERERACCLRVKMRFVILSLSLTNLLPHARFCPFSFFSNCSVKKRDHFVRVCRRSLRLFHPSDHKETAHTYTHSTQNRLINRTTRFASPLAFADHKDMEQQRRRSSRSSLFQLTITQDSKKIIGGLSTRKLHLMLTDRSKETPVAWTIGNRRSMTDPQLFSTVSNFDSARSRSAVVGMIEDGVIASGSERVSVH